VASSDRISAGDQTGLAFDARTITLFNADTGAALRSQANQGVLFRG
jgi:multiple sugar transport system ATP-binding protein